MSRSVFLIQGVKKKATISNGYNFFCHRSEFTEILAHYTQMLNLDFIKCSASYICKILWKIPFFYEFSVFGFILNTKNKDCHKKPYYNQTRLHRRLKMLHNLRLSFGYTILKCIWIRDNKKQLITVRLCSKLASDDSLLKKRISQNLL